RWYERMHSSVGIALILFGLLYFPSLPVMLTEAGNEGARRSWAFTYIGLSLLIAPIIPWLLRRAARWPHMEKVTLGGVAAILSIMLVGNVSMQTNEYYRFPGPYVYGSDTRSTTAE